jgi:hypothetical protein
MLYICDGSKVICVKTHDDDNIFEFFFPRSCIVFSFDITYLKLFFGFCAASSVFLGECKMIF